MPNNNPNKSTNTESVHTDSSSDEGSEMTVGDAVMEMHNVEDNDNNCNIEYMKEDRNYEDFLTGIEFSYDDLAICTIEEVPV